MLAMIKEALSFSVAAAASSSQPLNINGSANQRITSKHKLMGRGTSIFWSRPVDRDMRYRRPPPGGSKPSRRLSKNAADQ